MPTPVSAARQCLTEEAARALDNAVTVARRRSQPQTTSLHAVSALLALPSSTLRDACTRARSSGYSSRLQLQLRALELCVRASLDRLPSSKTAAADGDEPPVANSLMAAIKRSQANQRRQPETFQLLNQSSLTSVKVELKHFIVSILDDPIVSRVFGDAGFRSFDIKLAIIHPSPISRFSRSMYPPLFLCNLADSDSNRRSFNFPFAGFSGFENGDDCPRIGEVLGKKKGKNPLLIGICANEALSNFTESVQRAKSGILPANIDGLSIICIEKDIYEFVANNGSEELMGLKFKELIEMVENCSGTGVVVNFGDLKAFVDGGSIDTVSYVVSNLNNLLEIHGEKLWLIGATGNYETYMKFLARFPSIGKDWDLHLLPITSSKASIGGLYSKPCLMGSFVPLGGFFSGPSEFKGLLGSTNQSITHCNLCHEKYEQEVSVILKGGTTVSASDQYSASLSPWLQMAKCDTSKGLDAVKAKDDRAILNAKVAGLQRKWNDICQHLHSRKESSGKESSPKESGVETLSSFIPVDLQNISLPKRNISISVASEADKANVQTNLQQEVLRTQQLELSCVTSVTTDLGLGTLYACASEQPRKSKFQGVKDRLHSLSESVSADFDGFVENSSTQSSSCLDPKDFKSLWRVLADKVGWQDEAICTISRTVSHFRSGNGRRRGSNHRGDVWLSFLGPDKVGKKKIASALAEITFGCKECLISVDLSSEDGISRTNSIFDHQDLNGYDVNCRGKTVVDYIAGELSKKPRSVVLLENVENADFLAQSSLSLAIKTGKFQDSHGREIGINNMILIVTSNNPKGTKDIFSTKEQIKFPEERILEAKGWQMKIEIEHISGNARRSNSTNALITPREGGSNPFSPNKRKMTDNFLKIPKRPNKVLKACLDLNLPLEEMEEKSDYENCESDSASENSKAWLEEFFEQVDETVIFKPFDFDKLSEELLRKIDLHFKKFVGFEPLLEIDQEVMVQLLAASWLSDRKEAMENWLEKVLCKSFAEAKKMHCPTGHHVVKLVACEGYLPEVQGPGVCLPARVNVN